MDKFREEIIKAIKKEVKDAEITLEIPPKPELGDYAFPCFSLAKVYKKNPVEIAKELALKIKIKKSSHISEIKAIGPYLNFFINKNTLTGGTLKEILRKKDKFGSSNIGKKEKIILEHTSINPNASPHVGRARNALIGDSLARVLKFNGYKVEVHYFVNDIGKQIAMLVLAAKGKKDLKFEGLLKLYMEIAKKVEENKELEKEVLEILHKLEQGEKILGGFENINVPFKGKTKNSSEQNKARIEYLSKLKGDKKIIGEFKKIVGIAVKGQVSIFSELGINYDAFDYESDYLWSRKTHDALKMLEKTGSFFFDKDKRFVLDQKGFGLGMNVPVLVLTRGDGTSLYPLRDIAYALEMSNKGSNIVVLGEDQKLYGEQINAALKMLGKRPRGAVYYSFVLLEEGKMSTRSGNIVLLEDFMSEALKKAGEEIKKRYGKIDIKSAKMIAYGAVKYGILKVSPEKNVVFNIGQALNFEGETAPYIQYAYARVSSIIRKNKNKVPSKADFSLLDKKEEIELIKKLSDFPNIVKKTANELRPSTIANYAYELAKQFNEYYHAHNILKEEEKIKNARLVLVDCVRQVLKNSLNLLGIGVLERM